MGKSKMRTNKKTILLLSLMPIFLLSNCVSVQRPSQYAGRPEPDEKKQQNYSTAKRFQQSATQKPSVVESAMQLSQQHAKLSEETAVLWQQNHDLNERNKQLKDQVVALEAQLKQAQKELNEANDVLIAMRIELNNWKTDIIGFRDEMRDAETAQLEALLKILKVLGGEDKVESARNNKDMGSSSVVSLRKSIRP
jgi:chromosome segregation ATPase